MTFGDKLKSIRRSIGLTQEQVGTLGLVSTPGWIKLESGQRQASEKLIEELVGWLVQQKHFGSAAGSKLKAELLTLKYLRSNAPFLRVLAQTHAKILPTGSELLKTSSSAASVKRGRPKALV